MRSEGVIYRHRPGSKRWNEKLELASTGLRVQLLRRETPCTIMGPMWRAEILAHNDSDGYAYPSVGQHILLYDSELACYYEEET